MSTSAPVDGVAATVTCEVVAAAAAVYAVVLEEKTGLSVAPLSVSELAVGAGAAERSVVPHTSLSGPLRRLSPLSAWASLGGGLMSST